MPNLNIPDLTSFLGGVGRSESPFGDLRQFQLSDLFKGEGAGGLGAAGGAEAGTQGIPWAIIIPIAMSLIGEIAGKKDDPLSDALDLQKQMSMFGMKPPYQSPYTGSADKTVFQMLLNQMKRSANFGWPEGMGIDTSFITDALEQNFPGRTPEGIRRIRR
ncbi:MAG TPA: hypothetical protein ENI27_00590 [bacterium]|nr:hypothetical protein [bacterium]